MITTSGGGALICPDTESQSRIMFYATQARESYPYYQHEHIGYNYRLSNVCAGIGRGQMTVLNDHIAHHKHVHDLYTRLLANVKGITVHSNPTPDFDSNFGSIRFCQMKELRLKAKKRHIVRSLRALQEVQLALHTVQKAHIHHWSQTRMLKLYEQHWTKHLLRHALYGSLCIVNPFMQTVRHTQMVSVKICSVRVSACLVGHAFQKKMYAISLTR